MLGFFFGKYPLGKEHYCRDERQHSIPPGMKGFSVLLFRGHFLNYLFFRYFFERIFKSGKD